MKALNEPLLVIDGFGSGGAQRQMLNLSKGLLETEVSHKLLTLTTINDYPDLLIKYGVKADTIHHKNSWIKLIKLFRYVKKNKPSHIIVFLFSPSLYVLIVSLFFPKMKIIISERSFESAVRPIHKVLTRRLYWRASHIVANSRSQTSILSKKWSNAKFIPNGILDESFNEKRNYERSKTIVAIGRVSPLKNPMMLIRALSQYNLVANSSLKVIWVGDYDEYRNHFESCKDLLEEYNMSEYWTWIGKSRLVEKYIDMALFVYHGSFGEGFPNAICETMAREVPVIASDVFDHSTVIDDGQNGYLFDPNNLSELISKIESVNRLSDKEYINLSKEAKRTIQRRFSMEAYVSSYKALLEN